ncbi:MAG: 50S ribosomal protein L11 methyltransferase [Aggregatilineales bacterium]
MSKWLEISLRVDGEAAEAVAQELQKWCHQGIVVEQDNLLPDRWDEDDIPAPENLLVRGYLAQADETDSLKAQIERNLGYLNMMYPVPAPTYRIVDEENWADAWKVHYKPVRIGKRILIRPLWIEMPIDADDIEIALDPGMAFGTGTHPTTQLCLEAIEDLVTPGLDILDLGCGSGILAIAAAKLNAGSILAVDIDDIAVKSTIENATVNGVADKIEAQQGTLDSLITSPRRYDMLLVNILAKIIIPMCENGLGELVRPGGKAIFSGIIEDQVADVETALKSTGLTPSARRKQGDWILIEAHRPIA